MGKIQQAAEDVGTRDPATGSPTLPAGATEEEYLAELERLKAAGNSLDYAATYQAFVGTFGRGAITASANANLMPKLDMTSSEMAAFLAEQSFQTGVGMDQGFLDDLAAAGPARSEEMVQNLIRGQVDAQAAMHGRQQERGIESLASRGLSQSGAAGQLQQDLYDQFIRESAATRRTETLTAEEMNQAKEMETLLAGEGATARLGEAYRTREFAAPEAEALSWWQSLWNAPKTTDPIVASAAGLPAAPAGTDSTGILPGGTTATPVTPIGTGTPASPWSVGVGAQPTVLGAEAGATFKRTPVTLKRTAFQPQQQTPTL